MPSTTKKSTTVKSKPTEVKSSTTKTETGKKQGAVDIKTTSAHDKAKNFDEGRRNDANSNEL